MCFIMVNGVIAVTIYQSLIVPVVTMSPGFIGPCILPVFGRVLIATWCRTVISSVSCLK